MILLPTRFNRQPQRFTARSQFAQNIGVTYLFNAAVGRKPIDAIRGWSPSTVSGAGLIPQLWTPDGLGWGAVSGTGGYHSLAPTPMTYPFSLFAYGGTTNVLNSGPVIVYFLGGTGYCSIQYNSNFVNTNYFQAVVDSPGGSTSVPAVAGSSPNIVNAPHLAVAVFRAANNYELFVDGVSQGTGSTNGPTLTSLFEVGVGYLDNHSFGNLIMAVEGRFEMCGIAQGEIPAQAQREISQDPWILFGSPNRRIWVEAAAGGVTNVVGGGLDTLKAFTETGFAKTGSLGFASETLRALTETATGSVQAGISGFASGTLQHLTETAKGTAGAIGSARDTFKPLIESGGGTVLVNITASGLETFQHILETSTGFAGAKGFASATLRHLTESATGAIGSNAVIGYGSDTFKPITETGTGTAGALGFGFDSLRPLGSLAFGFSGAAPVVQPSQPSGFAWWGTTSSSFFYRTLDDKARELERLRLLRVELGILPEENKEIKQVIRQVEKFVEKKPRMTPAVIAKADDYNERLERLLARMDEEILEDDDRIIMEMSRFFFNFKEPSWKHP